MTYEHEADPKGIPAVTVGGGTKADALTHFTTKMLGHTMRPQDAFTTREYNAEWMVRPDQYPQNFQPLRTTESKSPRAIKFGLT